MNYLELLLTTLISTLGDVAPIVAIIVGFQLLVIRRPVHDLRRTLIGFVYVILGLALFLTGLEKALFPVGKLMATQMAGPVAADPGTRWFHYYWIYLFAASVGFATTLAEPSLIAVAIKAQQVSGNAITPRGLRLAVSIGVATGITIGTVRIVIGWPLHWFIIGGYLIVMVQTLFSPKAIIGLAYDSGGVTTSTVTVPLVTALGIGLATAVPGRNPVLDGFGLIAFAGPFSIIAVLAYAQFAGFRADHHESKGSTSQEESNALQNDRHPG
ncbi:MAG: DUF1538 domain-containing protein [Immundisolibacteraceae bacterium]|nr:DUF1538 domain-containing protein [Immundisolibacteraceae bacterium]